MEYEQLLMSDGNSTNYDLWFDYIRLEEQCCAESDYHHLREIYESAIAETPPIITDKRYWKRYIYLWLKYVMSEELVTQNMERVRSIYKLCNFTFGKVWISYAQFELR